MCCQTFDWLVQQRDIINGNNRLAVGYKAGKKEPSNHNNNKDNR